MQSEFVFNPFLTYDHTSWEVKDCAEDDGLYNKVHLSYKRTDSVLYIHHEDRSNKIEKQIEVPVELETKNDKEVLEDFIIDFLSNPLNFHATPEFVQSNLFTEEEFKEFQGKARRISEDRMETIVKEDYENELIVFCKDQGLNPLPEGYYKHQWVAHCPSKGNHTMMIYTKTKEWGCGYCGKKGGLIELDQWIATQPSEGNV